MKIHEISKLLTCILSIAVTTACNVRNVDSENFDYKLQGKWESNDKSLYNGTLYIEYNTITIKGYGEGQTRPNEDDDRRPFKGFIKETPLKGYSAEGKIFINNVGNSQEGIPYSYNNPSSGAEFLFLTFGSRQEILQKIQPN